MKIYKKENVIAFFSYHDYMSNHFYSDFKLDGHLFKSVEQAMMYKKAELFNDQDIMDKLLIETFPRECKNLGKAVKPFNGEIWDQNKEDIVFECVYAKFNQNTQLKNKLLGTKDALLVEASPYDKIWGVKLAEDNPDVTNPSKWKGQNLLGKILMDVREKIYEESFLYKEIKGDVFGLSDKYYIVQSVSQDGAMGVNNKGKVLPCFATEVLKRYPDVKKKFQKQNPGMPDCIMTDKIINLVTKTNYWEKPKLEDIKIALEKLKNIAEERNIEYLAMPQIESGMNKMDWRVIRGLILEVFEDSSLKIVVCIF